MAENTLFSENLKALRKKQGVTQEQLANHLGVSAQAVSKWENGSYPEGDLLPKIAGFFNVSISYLYGEVGEDVSIEQKVLDIMAEIRGRNDSTNYKEVSNEYMNKMLDIIWSFQIGGWANNNNYYERGVPPKDVRTASALGTDSGYSFLNLNREKEFFLLLKEHEDGWAKNLPISDWSRNFFKILGKEGAMEIAYYMLSLRGGEYVTSSNIANEINLPLDKTQELLKEMGEYQVGGNPPFYCIDVYGKDGVEKGYGVNTSAVPLFIGLFIVADSLINPPMGYQMQINSRRDSWLKKEDVKLMLKEHKGKE
ncbi:MAG: helix-turn-helix domain-containing protein [Lachnospiraceae bacterium]|nr:helix-turn-helix domain-containing protein [Lachnospiraceae bacterium]